MRRDCVRKRLVVTGGGNSPAFLFRLTIGDRALSTGFKLTHFMTQDASNVLQDFLDAGYDMEGDLDLFECINNRYKRDFQYPHVVTGQIAYSKISDGFYTLRYIGPNPTPKTKEMAKVLAANVQEARKNVQEAIEKIKTAAIDKEEPAGELQVKPQGVKLETVKPKKATIIE